MTWVKICGMTNLEDALVAVDAGADAVGFVFYEKSPRCVTVEKAREICEKLPESVEKVGVFVGSSAQAVIGTSDQVGLTVAQVYPDANHQLALFNDEFFQKAKCGVIVAMSARVLGPGEEGGFFISNGTRDRILAMLVDSGNSERPGGTGEPFDWKHGALIKERMERLGVKLIVAGGLSPHNVTTAVDVLHPWGVDVVSGVEASPGKKDPEKVRAFVRAVREYDRRVG